MDQSGIEKAIISGSQSDYLFTSNDWIAEQVRKYPDRLYGCASVNPKKGMESVREFERSVKELGLIGLRFYPYAMDIRRITISTIPFIRSASN